MTPDVNVLVAASRQDHAHHVVASEWMDIALDAVRAGVSFTLLPMVVASFLRLVTSPKIFQLPTPVEDAIGFVDAVLTVDGVQLAGQGPEWRQLRQLCIDQRLHGNDLPNAWLAATVDYSGEHLVTFDRDFRKLLARGQLTLLDTKPKK